jgi:hypothetical protein
MAAEIAAKKKMSLNQFLVECVEIKLGIKADPLLDDVMKKLGGGYSK